MKDSYTNLIKLSSLLNDCQFHDGDNLGLRLGITRAAIWKMTNKLVDYGVPITSVKGKGYALTEPLILLDKKIIEASLDKTLAEQIDLTVLETTPSTATFLRNHFSQNKKSLCLAEHQSVGIGRLGRSWTSPFGLNIYFSCRYHFQCDIADLSGLSLATSIAVVKTLEKFGAAPQIKWPNDIYCDHKKIAGNLIELIAESNGSCQAIISVGINVNMINSTDNISQPWTSLREQTGVSHDRNTLSVELIQELFSTLEQFRSQGLPYFKDIYHHYDYLDQRPVVIEQFQSTLEGKAIGIDDFGRLLLQMPTGKITPISAGDASLKKKTRT
jgi:BirA family biotin operon repressor/biotin-[acetyl-CoA-carboxylase] ligase